MLLFGQDFTHRQKLSIHLLRSVHDHSDLAVWRHPVSDHPSPAVSNLKHIIKKNISSNYWKLKELLATFL